MRTGSCDAIACAARAVRFSGHLLVLAHITQHLLGVWITKKIGLLTAGAIAIAMSAVAIIGISGTGRDSPVTVRQSGRNDNKGQLPDHQRKDLFTRALV